MEKNARRIKKGNDVKYQTVKDHCLNVAEMSKLNAEQVGLGNTAWIIGLLHDVGKFSTKFQSYLSEEKKQSEKEKVNHSSAGGIYINKYRIDENLEIDSDFIKLWKELVAYAIVSHHGIIDVLNLSGKDILEERLNHDEDIGLDEVNADIEILLGSMEFDEIVNTSIKEINDFFTNIISLCKENELPKDIAYFMCGLLQRYLLSICVNADRSDAQAFAIGPSSSLQINDSVNETYKTYLHNLEKTIENFDTSSELNRLRKKLSNEAVKKAKSQTGIYKLTIPTGGGKTFCGFRYALKHAIENGKTKIFYVAPYISIVEQNADEIKKVFNDENILEHHSNIVNETNGEWNQLMYYEQDWNAPVTLTTMARFLEVAFGSNMSDIRRFQGIANSVIIVDEVQKIPTHMLNLVITLFNFVANMFNCTIVLCSATQPNYENIDKKLLESENSEIVKITKDDSEVFKRTKIIPITVENNNVPKLEKYDVIKLAEFVKEHFEKSMLVVLNTKKDVRELYQKLCEDSNWKDVEIYQLTTYMCPQHRLDVINKMKEHLASGKKVLCISTQLIEAGVDISFVSVVRALAGLDSIIQSAGRCNRNYELNECGKVYVLDLEDDNRIKTMKEIKLGKDITRDLLLSKKTQDLMSEEVINEFYEKMFQEQLNCMDYKVKVDNKEVDLYDLLSKNVDVNELHNMNHLHKECKWQLKQSYQTAGKQFKVIDNYADITLLVPYEESIGKIQELKEYCLNGQFNKTKKLLKKLQRYTVNLNEYDSVYENLVETNGICDELKKIGIYIVDQDHYDEKIGL